MRFSKVLRLQNASKINEIISSARSTLNEAPQFFNQVKEEKKKIMYDKIIKLNNWYMKVIGIEEVKQAQDKVLLLQDELSKTREKRRDVEVKLNEVNLSRGEIHNEMSKVDKNTNFPRYIELKNQEIEILKVTNKLQDFGDYYKDLEREHVNRLSTAVDHKLEAQRLQTEYTKYIYAVLAIIGSFGAYQYRKGDIKRFKDLTLTSVNENIKEMKEDLRNIREKQNEPGIVAWIVWGIKYPYTYFTRNSESQGPGTMGYLKKGAIWVYSWVPGKSSWESFKGATIWLVKCIPGVSKSDKKD